MVRCYCLKLVVSGHKVNHSAICEYYDVPTDGEDAAWTMGFLMRQAVKMITSKYMPTATPRAWA